MGYLEHFMRGATSISRNSIVRAVRKGMLYMLPLTLIGSVALLVLNLPVTGFQNGMDMVFGGSWRQVAESVYKGTFQIMSLTALLAVSYCLSAEKDQVRSGEVSQISVLLTVFASYIAFSKETHTVIDFERSSSTGLFSALVIAITATGLFFFFLRFKVFRLPVFTNDADSILMASLNVLLAAFLTVFSFALVKGVTTHFYLGEWTGSIYQEVITKLFQGERRLLSAVLFSLLSHIMWFFGIHGTNMLDGVAADLYLAASEINIGLAATGGAPTEIFTKEFFDHFVYLGGCGTTLGLLIALLIEGKGSNIRRMSKLSLLPGIFNINEMMIYGLPVIFNPFYLIPFLCTPILLTLISYGAMGLGVVPLTTTRVFWTAPVFVSGYISTGSVSGALLQLFNLAVSVLIYLPFVRLYESYKGKDSMEVFKALTREIVGLPEFKAPTVLSRSDEVGILARALAADIRSHVTGGRTCLHLEYQPKVNFDGQVLGAEALLRWQHPVYGAISPLVILNIAEEAGLGDQLGSWVMRSAFSELKVWHEKGYRLTLSVNLSPRQLSGDKFLVKTVLDAVRMCGVDPKYMELELTENAAIDQSEKTRDKLQKIKELGLNISIDDYGMGHSSILYLRDFYANVVKLDRSLVRALDSELNRSIVRSITSLCEELKVLVIAEGVETLEQAETLRSLGCHYYQGFYFSRSLKPEAFLAFVGKHGVTAN